MVDIINSNSNNNNIIIIIICANIPLVDNLNYLVYKYPT
jgi:hypothetical protein